jgi:peptide-methionine (S)-S-oxide reductase
MKTEKATLAMGCFWSPDLLFSKTNGIISVKVGYTGGIVKFKTPTYEKVCSGSTNHAEAVEIIFDPKKITYKEILELFWTNHNPTTINRQGLDIGNQYRSSIFYHNEKQRSLALESKKQYQKKLKKEIVTEIVKAKDFYPAEDYHQKYLEKRGQKTCYPIKSWLNIFKDK